MQGNGREGRGRRGEAHRRLNWSGGRPEGELNERGAELDEASMAAAVCSFDSGRRMAQSSTRWSKEGVGRGCAACNARNRGTTARGGRNRHRRGERQLGLLGSAVHSVHGRGKGNGEAKANLASHSATCALKRRWARRCDAWRLRRRERRAQAQQGSTTTNFE